MNILASLLFLTGADFPVCVAAGFQQMPAAAYANGRFYAFWLDDRNGGLYGARITTGGAVLDPSGRLLFSGDASETCNAAFDGTNFFVIFRNYC